MKDFKDKMSQFFENIKQSFKNLTDKKKTGSPSEKKVSTAAKAKKETSPKEKKPKTKKPRKINPKTGKPRNAFLHGLKIFILVTLIVVFLGGAIVGGLAIGYVLSVIDKTDLSVIDDIVATYELHKALREEIDAESGELKDALSLNLTSYMYAIDENGNEIQLGKLYDEENREWAELDMNNYENSEIPKYLVDAFISIEDERFMTHKGFDVKRTLGATISYLEKKIKKSNDRTYGGSTITQQLIKNYTDDDDYSIDRKIQELYRAYMLEQKLEKDEILELYLNTIYLSQQCNGVRSASKVYFNKEPKDLTLEECATIAAITQFPTKYDPIRNPESNKERRDVILNKMLELGYITEAQCKDAKSKPVVTVKQESHSATEEITSYYTDALIEQVLNDLVEQKGCSEAIAKQLLYSGGLRVYSAMNPRIQQIMDDYYADESNFQTLPNGGLIQSAMVVIDPDTGYVAGIIGGRGEKTASRTLNRATQTLRQPGSSIKPLTVYAPAIEYGFITPDSIVSDVELEIDGWSPKNDNRTYLGDITVSAAIAKSRNVAAVRILQHMGLGHSFNFLKNNFRISTLVTSKVSGNQVLTDKGYASLGLGGLTDGVSVLEMAAAYVPFASRGKYYEPSFYTKVTDSHGNIILERTPNPQPAISESTAYSMTQMLQGAVTSGTGTSARLSNMPAAGKTGTTSNNHDRWFVGYTPHYVGAVWFGYDEPKSLSGLNGNPSAKIWNGVMEKIHEGYEYTAFNSLGDAQAYLICADSGFLPNSTCTHLDLSTYPRKNAPKTRCIFHTETDFGTGDLVIIPEPEESLPEEETETLPEDETSHETNSTPPEEQLPPGI